MPGADEATAMTMAFTTFVLFQLCNAINARAGRGTVFHRDQLRNPVLWLALAAVLAIQVTVVYLPWAQTVFGTVAVSAGQWAICAQRPGTRPATGQGTAGSRRRRRRFREDNRHACAGRYVLLAAAMVIPHRRAHEASPSSSVPCEQTRKPSGAATRR